MSTVGGWVNFLMTEDGAHTFFHRSGSPDAQLGSTIRIDELEAVPVSIHLELSVVCIPCRGAGVKIVTITR